MLKIHLIIVAALIATVYAGVGTPVSRIETAPGIVCPMTVCPTNTLDKRAPPSCPTLCPDNCRIIDDPCCPGIQKAICSSPSESASETSATPTVSSSVAPSSSVISTPGPTSSIPASSILASSAPASGTSSSISMSASVSVAPSVAASSNAAASSSSAANAVRFTLSSTIIAASIVAGFHFF